MDLLYNKINAINQVRSKINMLKTKLKEPGLSESDRKSVEEKLSEAETELKKLTS